MTNNSDSNIGISEAKTNARIVQRLRESVKTIEDLTDKDTIYDANSKRLKLVLPYLKSIFNYLCV